MPEYCHTEYVRDLVTVVERRRDRLIGGGRFEQVLATIERKKFFAVMVKEDEKDLWVNVHFDADHQARDFAGFSIDPGYPQERRVVDEHVPYVHITIIASKES